MLRATVTAVSAASLAQTQTSYTTVRDGYGYGLGRGVVAAGCQPRATHADAYGDPRLHHAHRAAAGATSRLCTPRSKLVQLEGATVQVSRDEVAALLGGYGAPSERAAVTFEPARGLSLVTGFGALPLAALSGAPGTFFSTGVTVGVAVTLASDPQLTISGLSEDTTQFPLVLPRVFESR